MRLALPSTLTAQDDDLPSIKREVGKSSSFTDQKKAEIEDLD